MMYLMRMLAGLALAALMTACGGGGGSPGTTAGGSGGGTGGIGSNPVGTPTLSVSDFALFTDKATLNNSGSDKAQLTVVALDANRNVVPGAAVSVATDQGSVFTPSGGSVTDTGGTYTGNVSIGSDKTDRTITVKATVNGISKQVALRVAGSRLTLQAVPPTPAPGQNVALTLSLVDSSSNPIPNATVKLGGPIAALQDQTVVTDQSGSAVKSFAAPTAPGIYTITASGNGVSAVDYQVQVFASAVPNAVIPVGATPSLSASPNVLPINAPGSTANKAALRFLFLNAANQPIQNVRVRFSDETTGLAAVGASISSGTSTLYTDMSGTVVAEYISGQNSSPTNGVTIRACYSATDFPAGTCPASISASLTVAGQALAVSIGDDNLLEKGDGTYVKRFAITVADSAGRAVPNAPVDISVDLTHYGKGSYEYSYVQDGQKLPANRWLSVVPQSLLASYPSPTAQPSEQVGRVWCRNEDTNRNGNFDTGDFDNKSADSNGQPTLEPRKSDLLVSYAVPTVSTTNANGILIIKVEYSQRFATWLAYKVRVTANVQGSQGMAERLFLTNFVEGDDKNGSFLEPPYGFNSCSVAN